MVINMNEIIKIYYANKNDCQAEQMAAYMKDNFPFLGIKKPQRIILQKLFVKQFKRSKKIDWTLIFNLWELEEREFQYLALDLINATYNHLRKNDIKKIEKLIVTKSWWDTVDFLSSKVTGELCREYPALKEDIRTSWSKSDNIWLSRSAILFQLRYKEKTDTDLLCKIIAENSSSDNFFINKAIGWALREFSKTDKEWVKNFIQQNRLNSLSVREGSKYIDT